MTPYVTSLAGTVHHVSCRYATDACWPWHPRNDGPGVARPCRRCLPSGLPVELVEVER